MESQGNRDRGENSTVGHLRRVAYAPAVWQLARLPAESQDAWLAAIARRAPAGRAPAQVLARLAAENPAGSPPPSLNQIQQDVQNLFAALNDAPATTPAALLWAYRRLLLLAGIDPQRAFAQGALQAYAAYGLRDDPAHHTIETDGFDSRMVRAGLALPMVDRLAALLMAGSDLLYSYPALLENAWRERVYTRLLFETCVLQPGQPTYENLFREWEARHLPAFDPAFAPAGHSTGEQYARWRRIEFDQFLQNALRALPDTVRSAWMERIQAAEAAELPAYLRQMHLLAYFEPGLHGEIRHSLPLAAAHVGVVVRGAYFLIPVVAADGRPLTDPSQARALAASLFGPLPAGVGPGGGAFSALTTLARVQRSAMPGLRALFSQDTLAALDTLRTAPLLINMASPGGTGSLGRSSAAGQPASVAAHPRAGSQPPGRRQLLARVRLGERGLGDHPLTVFDSGSALALDAAASLFDPHWAIALAEVYSLLAAQAAARLGETPPSTPPAGRAGPQARAVVVRFQPGEAEQIQRAPLTPVEACAEVDSVQLRPALQLRSLCKQNPELPQLAVNDLLVLYRAIHTYTYRPPAGLLAEISELQNTPNPSTRTGALIAAATRQTLEMLRSPAHDSPTLVLYLDVSARSPVERQRALRVRVPVSGLNLVGLHQRAMQTLDVIQGTTPLGGNRAPQELEPLPAKSRPEPGANLQDFRAARAEYLAALGAYGAVMYRLREATLLGESPFVADQPVPAALAGMMQTLVGGDDSPYDLFAELDGGEELFTNLGMAAPGSSLTRFLPARDDDPRRGMAWGLITSASGVMHITLRDFRPHVAHLHEAGLRDMADRIAQDYLNAYARGFNRFVFDLTQLLRSTPPQSTL